MRLLSIFEPFLGTYEEFLAFMQSKGNYKTEDPALLRFPRVEYTIMMQYARRIVFHEPQLALKATDKISFKDFFMDETFSLEDVRKFAIMMEKRMEIGLVWFKDSILEALVMHPNVNASKDDVARVANLGKLGKYSS